MANGVYLPITVLVLERNAAVHRKRVATDRSYRFKQRPLCEDFLRTLDDNP
jgi:hypothetical protein